MCVFRFSNFKIRGTFHSSVLLFTSSDNKDIVRLTNVVHADKVTIDYTPLMFLPIKRLRFLLNNPPHSQNNVKSAKCFQHVMGHHSTLIGGGKVLKVSSNADKIIVSVLNVFEF